MSSEPASPDSPTPDDTHPELCSVDDTGVESASFDSALWQRLAEQAAVRADTAALYLPRGRSWSVGAKSPSAASTYHALTYTQLLQRSLSLAEGLARWGVRPGLPVAVLVPISEQFFTLMFALVKLGAVPVLIDPGIGTAALKTCLDEANPQVFIGNSKALTARKLLAWCPNARVVLTDAVPATALRLLRSPVTTLASILAGTCPAAESEEGSPADSTQAESTPALVAYTSGSTGPAKGVQLSTEALTAQIETLRQLYALEPGVVNVSTFAPFALLGPLLGLTTVVPRMDFSRPAQADPAMIAEAITAFNASVMFASPALLNTLQRWARPAHVRLPSLHTVITAGAAVSRRLQQQMLTILPDNAQIHTPYGSTEALPVTTIGSTEILALRHSGICVGRPVEGINLALVPICDQAIPSLPDEPDVPVGQVGEVVVQGPQVSTTYYHRPSADTANKTLWRDQVAHRMGDLAYRDGQGRLWLCGRRAERVITPESTLYTTICEEITNAHPWVERSALVGLGPRGKQRPVMIIQPTQPRLSPADLTQECLTLLAANSDTAMITTVLLKDRFPVDVRHNAKIRRLELAEWASRELARIENRPPSRVSEPLPPRRAATQPAPPTTPTTPPSAPLEDHS